MELAGARILLCNDDGIASTGFESPSISSLRFDPGYFKDLPKANRDIFHTAIHETLHMLACEEGDPCTVGRGPRFLDTGVVSFLTRNAEFATYQLGDAFETALTDASCSAPRGSFESRFTGWGQEGVTGPVSFFR